MEEGGNVDGGSALICSQSCWSFGHNLLPIVLTIIAVIGTYRSGGEPQR